MTGDQGVPRDGGRPARPARRRLPRRIAVLGLAAVIVLIAGGAGVLVLGRLAGESPVEALGPPVFVDDGPTAGIDLVYDGDWTFSTGGGIAAFDCNGDGRQDLYISGGVNPAALYRNDSTVGGPLAFTRLPDPTTDLTAVNGAYPVDIDGDGLVDLAVLRIGGVDLLRGLGDCRFQPANDAWSFDSGGGFASAFSATWETSASLPTLAIGRYLALDATGKVGKIGTGCAANSLVRPTAGGSGYAAPVQLDPGFCTLSMVFSDWDGSGRRDLRVSNDRHYYDNTVGEEQLWRVAPGEGPRLYTADDGWVRVQIEGMGIASYDLTGDGYPEVYLTSQNASKLQTLLSGPAQPTYRDIGLKRGVNVAQPFVGDIHLPSTAWHPEFQDVNNDGFIDLYVTKGNVTSQPDFAMRDPSNLLLGQPDGTFTEAADVAGILNFDRGRGAVLADLNLDGLLDLVEVNYGAPVRVWRNVGEGTSTASRPMGHWLALALDGAGANRDAIGAWVEVRIGDTVLRREVAVGGGHAGGELGWIHVGLGPSSTAEVRVQWPDGELGPWMRADADQFLALVRGASSVTPWRPTP